MRRLAQQAFACIICSFVFLSPHVFAQQMQHFACSSDLPIVVQTDDISQTKEFVEVIEYTLLTLHRQFGVKIDQELEYEVHWNFYPLLSLKRKPFSHHIVQSGNHNFKFIIEGYGNSDSDLEDLCRNLVNCFLKTSVLRLGGNLNSIEETPYLLVEGLTQYLLPEKHERLQQVVKRTLQLNRAPEFDSMLKWKKSSDTWTENWQQAFAYWYVQRAIESGRIRDFLGRWILRQVRSDYYFALDFREPDPVWWREQLIFSQWEALPFLSWEETSIQLEELSQIKMVQGSDLQLLHVLHLPRGVDQIGIKEKINSFLQLQSRAHFAWQPLVHLYVEALFAWDCKQYNKYEIIVAKIRKERKRVENLADRVNELLNSAQFKMSSNF